MGYPNLKKILPCVVLSLATATSFAQGTTAKNNKTTKSVPAMQVAPVLQEARMPTAALNGFSTRKSDKSYRAALTRWLAEAPGEKWQLSWELEDDYTFDFDGDFGTDLFKAVDSLCAALNASGVRARAYPYEGNHVIRIVLEGASR
jgi:hypothetical protein